MTEPTRQDALDAALVFYSALMFVLNQNEGELVNSPLFREPLTTDEIAYLVIQLALEMGLDLNGLERAAIHLWRHRLSGESLQIIADAHERLRKRLRDSNPLRN